VQCEKKDAEAAPLDHETARRAEGRRTEEKGKASARAELGVEWGQIADPFAVALAQTAEHGVERSRRVPAGRLAIARAGRALKARRSGEVRIAGATDKARGAQRKRKQGKQGKRRERGSPPCIGHERAARSELPPRRAWNIFTMARKKSNKRG
jgi:hypothetical protein